MNNLVGVDVSHWQSTMNWTTAKGAGCQFALIKCTQGISFFDSQFNANWGESRKAGIPRGAYHWYEPEMNPVSQANWFWTHVNELGELPLVLDVEDGSGIPGDYAVKLKQCLDRLLELSGSLPMIYTRSSYWKVYLKKAMDWGHKYPLWVAHYKENSGPTTCLPWTPGTWAVWQFTSSGPGKKYGAVSLEIDMNVSNGDLPPVTTMTRTERLIFKSSNVVSSQAEVIEPSLRERAAEMVWKYRKNPRQD